MVEKTDPRISVIIINKMFHAIASFTVFLIIAEDMETRSGILLVAEGFVAILAVIVAQFFCTIWIFTLLHVFYYSNKKEEKPEPKARRPRDEANSSEEEADRAEFPPRQKRSTEETTAKKQGILTPEDERKG